MLVAIISDIHANLEALLAVRADIKAQGAECVLCAGDMVGYGADPNECVEIVRDLCADGSARGRCGIVLGNHDDAAVGGDLTLFSALAKRSAEWTRTQISVPNRQYIKKLDLALEFNGNLIITHASPHDPHQWNYIDDIWEVSKCFRRFREWVGFIGHTHVPYVAVMHRMRPEIIQEPVTILKPDARYLINVGSVGQPRDGNPRASYGLFDTDSRRYELRRVAYDVQAAGDKIIAAGLPSALAERLAMGW